MTVNHLPSRGPHYDLAVQLSPAKGKVRVAATITWPLAPDDQTQLTLALHSSALIDTLEADQPARWTLGGASPVQFAPDAARLVIVPASGNWQPTHPVRIVMRYSITAQPGSAGYMTAWQVNRISFEWTELGLYTPWFPLAADLREFTYTVLVASDQGAPCLGAGTVISTQGGWRLESRQPDCDCVLVSAPDLRSVEGTHLAVIYAADDHKPLAEQALADCEWLLLDYAERFGRLADAAPLRLLIAPRPKGGGYARHGLVVVTPDGLADQNRALRLLAHETAHLWWRDANTSTWEDWLNEGFAEYCAVDAVRRRLGEAVADALLTTKRERTAGLPPIRGLARDNEQAQLVLYDKGCLVLTGLERRIGKQAMAKLLRRAWEEKVRSTDALLSLLHQVAGEPAEEWLADQLLR